MARFKCRRLRPNEESKTLEFRHYRSVEFDVVEVEPGVKDHCAVTYIQKERSVPGQSLIFLEASSIEEAGKKADAVLDAIILTLE